MSVPKPQKLHSHFFSSFPVQRVMSVPASHRTLEHRCLLPQPTSVLLTLCWILQIYVWLCLKTKITCREYHKSDDYSEVVYGPLTRILCLVQILLWNTNDTVISDNLSHDTRCRLQRALYSCPRNLKCFILTMAMPKNKNCTPFLKCQSWPSLLVQKSQISLKMFAQILHNCAVRTKLIDNKQN